MDENKKVTNELSEDELEAVAGGAYCGCVIGGGGTADQAGEKTCACVVGGGGNMSNGDHRCICLCGGAGFEGEEVQ